MPTNDSLLTSEAIQMLVSSMTQKGTVPLQELEVERFLNAVARAQSGVPTGPSFQKEKSKTDEPG